MGEIHHIDEEFYKKIRENVTRFIKNCSSKYIQENTTLLDIAPQDHQEIGKILPSSVTYKTLDIDPQSGADYIADLCEHNYHIPNDSFDYIFCNEVLEHTLNPFLAVDELYRIVKKDGYVFVTTPFNFRIHGPLPDCWRFTVHGLKQLFKNFEIIRVDSLESDRFLTPIHYTTVVKKI